MSDEGEYRNKRQQKINQSCAVSHEVASDLIEDSSVLDLFKNIALDLTERHDRHERLVKLSRDITIESKRIIFLLHSANTKESTEKAVNDANERIQKLIVGPIKSIGLELEHSPAHLHSKAVSSGFQEFIEARTFCSLIESKVIITYHEVQKELQYQIKEEDSEEYRTVVTYLPYMDYMLGLADMTGELMRRAFHSMSSGATEDSNFACLVLKKLYAEYIGLGDISKELTHKISVTKSNVMKVEDAQYAQSLRRSEEASLPLLRKKTWEEQHSDEGCL